MGLADTEALPCNCSKVTLCFVLRSLYVWRRLFIPLLAVDTTVTGRLCLCQQIFSATADVVVIELEGDLGTVWHTTPHLTERPTEPATPLCPIRP